MIHQHKFLLKFIPYSFFFLFFLLHILDLMTFFNAMIFLKNTIVLRKAYILYHTICNKKKNI